MPMRIFTFRKVVYLLTMLMFSALSSSALTIVSVKDGNWSDPTTWYPQQIPTSADVVTIKSEHTVVVDLNATCGKLIVGESNEDNTDLVITAGKFLNVIGAVEIYGNNVESNPTIFDVGDGILNVGENITFYASPGWANLEIGNGTINVVGNLDFNASGQGNLKRRTVENAGTINLGGSVLGIGNIEGNQPSTGNVSLPNDYYRSQKSGDWSEIISWITSRDGSTNWQPAKFVPTGSALRIEVMSAHKISLTTNSPAANLIVYGTLECKQHIINGPGPFRLESGATFITSNSLGISSSATTGSIQVDGARIYSSNANYTYEAAECQATGDGLPATLNGILTVNNTATPPVVTLSQPTLSTKLVFVTNGTLASDGNLTLQSIASKYAQIGPLVGNAKVTGDVNVQSFFTGGSGKRGSRMISLPVKDDGLPTVYQQIQQNMVVTGPGGPTNLFDSGGGNPDAVTLSTYYEPANPISSFISVPNLRNETRAEVGKAVFVFFRGNRNNATGNKVNTPYATPEDVVGNYKGTINQGDITTTITHSNLTGDTNNGINAVGNPYPAAIDWEKVYASNSSAVDNIIRIVKPGGGMVTRKMVGSTPHTINSTDMLGSQYIQPGQGFYIQKSNVGSSTFIFSESHKAVSNYAGRILSIPEIDRFATSLGNGQHIKDVSQEGRLLRVNIQQGDLKDETLIVFQDGFSTAFDHNDAIYFAGNTVLVGSMSSDGKVTSINAMPDVKDVAELKLYVSASASGAYTLNFSDLSAGQGYQVFLKDALFPDKLVDLHQQSSYDFNIERTNVATYGTNRFSVIFKPELVEAPVVFTAQKVKSNVELNWTSEAAQKIKYFEVEVSADKASFANIGQVANAGKDVKVQYSFVDKSPESAIRYYRLKQFNFNGSVTYTDLRMIDLSGISTGVESITVYPNPTSDRIGVNLNQKTNAGVQAAIFNVQGQKMKTAAFSANENVNMQVSEFPGGVYLLELRNPSTNELIGHSKFVIGR